MNNLQKHYIDFSKHINLTDGEKAELEMIQQRYYPIERTEYLEEFYINGKITDDEYEKLTTVTYSHIE